MLTSSRQNEAIMYSENCDNEIQLIALKVKILQRCCQIQLNMFDAIRKIKLS